MKNSNATPSPFRRLNPRHQDMVRAKIQASAIVHRLTECIKGKIDLSAQQVSAAKILLDKSIPNLTSTELSGPDGKDLTLNIVDPTRRGPA